MATRILAAAGLVLVLLLAACGDDDPAVPAPTGCPEPADAAPGFVLTGLDGAEVSLAGLRCAKVVVVDFWATWCAPCRVGLPLLQELHDTYGARGLAVLAVNIGEGEETVRAFMDEQGYTFAVCIDRDRQATEAYQVSGIPRQFIIDAAGVVRHDLLGSTAVAEFPYGEVIPALLADLPDAGAAAPAADLD